MSQDKKPSNVVDFVAFKAKKTRKDLVVCPYCFKVVDRTPWPVKTYMCNVNEGTHEPYIHKLPPKDPA